MVNFVPEDMIGYHWNTCFDANDFIVKIKDNISQRYQLQENPPVEAQVNGFHESLVPVLETFGDEMGGYLQDVNLEGLYPIPQALLFFKVKEEGEIKTVLDNVLNQPFFSAETEDHLGVTIHYSDTPFGEVLQPAYCFLDEYLFISMNTSLIKMSLDSYFEEDSSLAEEEWVKTFGFDFDKPMGAMQSVKIRDLTEEITAILEWFDASMESRDNQGNAFRDGSERSLKDAKDSVVQMNQELIQLQEQYSSTEESYWNLKEQGINVSQKQIELANLRTQIEEKEKLIVSGQEKVSEMEEIVGGYDEQYISKEMREKLLNQIAYPLLDCLRTFEAFGSRLIFTDEFFNISVFIK